MKNVVTRYNLAIGKEKYLQLGITHKSLTYNSEPIGFKEVTVYIASTLHSLGIKEISIRPPLQNRHVFSLLNIITGKDSTESKIDKLTPFFSEDENKPITLTPVTSHSMALRISDEMIQKLLLPLSKPQEEGGTGFLNALKETSLTTLPDLYSWISIKSSLIPENIRSFVLNMVDATREGFFPIDRFLKAFPLPDPLRDQLSRLVALPPPVRPRKNAVLGHQFRPSGKNQNTSKIDIVTHLSTASNEEVAERKEILGSLAIQSVQQDLELSQTLMSEQGPNFKMGIRLLLRILGNQNTVAVQEKALKLGIRIWTNYQNMSPDAQMMSLLSSLRQKLCEVHNISLIFFPLRNLMIDSDLFKRITAFIASLGESSVLPLLQSLEAEEERAMRRKLIHVITYVVKEEGDDILIDKLSTAPNFLLRNVILILGDIKSEKSIEGMALHLKHPFKIVRTEAVRSLSKIGSKKALETLFRNLSILTDIDIKRMIIDIFVARKDQKIVDPIIRMANDKKHARAYEKSSLSIFGNRGWPQSQAVFDLSSRKILLLWSV